MSNLKYFLLGELIQIKKGKKPSQISERIYSKRYLPYLLIDAIEGQNKLFTDDSSCPIAKKSDTLLVWDGARSGLSSTGHCGYVGSTLALISKKSEIVHSSYLFYFISNKEKQIHYYSEGTGIPHVSRGFLESLKIPIPSLIEQKKITEVLASFDKIIHLLSQEISKYDFLLKGLTIELTSKNKDSNNDVHSIIDQEVNFQGGSQPPRASFKFRPAQNLVRLLQIRDYKSDKNASYIPKELSKRWCSKKDVMISRYGPPNFQILRGKEGSYNVALIKATPKSEKRLNNEYLYRFLSRYDLFETIDKLSQRTSGQQGLDMNALKLFPLPLKPLKDQIKVAYILQELEDYKNKLVAKRGKYIFLKNALSNDFFKVRKRAKV